MNPKQKITWAAVVIGSLMFLFGLGFLNNIYEDFTCHGCSHFPSLKTAIEDKALIALYVNDEGENADTLYLTRMGRWHVDAYHEYTEKYFLGLHSPVDHAISKIETDVGEHLLSLKNGDAIGLSGIRSLPQSLFCLDSCEKVFKEYPLTFQSEENQTDLPPRSRLRAWREYMR
jgi:hypothetical protein